MEMRHLLVLASALALMPAERARAAPWHTSPPTSRAPVTRHTNDLLVLSLPDGGVLGVNHTSGAVQLVQAHGGSNLLLPNLTNNLFEVG